MTDIQSTEPAPTGTRRRRPPRWLLVGLALVILVAGGVGYWYFSGHETTDDAQIDGHIMPVSPRIGGTVSAVKVEDNQRVEAGDVLVELDPRDYQVALDRAKAELQEAQAQAQAARTGVPVASTTTASQVESAESAVATAEARLRSAQANLREAEARDAKAGQDLERLKTLVAKDEVSRQEYDSVHLAAEAASAAREAAAASVREAEEGVAAAKARLREARTAPEQVKIMQAQAASADARVARAEASLERARLDLDHTRVVAPAAGVVSKRSVEVGQVVQAGQPLLAVVPLGDVWVTANFKESQLRNIRPGQPATIEVDAYGGRRYRGRVDSIAAATGARFSLLPPENATGNYVKVVQRVPVKIVFEKGQDPDHLLRPGMSVVPTVLTR